MTSHAQPSKMKQSSKPDRESISPTPAKSTINALQSSEQKRLLDAVDQLRTCGFENDLPLPQLVVCGDQSAGKSSVLEALTEIDFPRADNTCTRHATEIIMRHAPKERISVKIIPDPDRSSEEVGTLRQFNETIDDFRTLTSQIGWLIGRAKEAMGIDTDDGVPGTKGFSGDILSIEIEGPDRPQFTVVDLPGMFANQKKSGRGSKKLVDNLTRKFIRQRRTICLAVIAASNDADNQSILSEVQAADPDGIRSLGIITKPDKLDQGSKGERFFVELAQNKNPDYFFKHGWHVLRNRRFEEENHTFAERNETEKLWFRSSSFQHLDNHSLGIDNLRNRLSRLLFEHVKRELPNIHQDINNMVKTSFERLTQLGSNRSTTEEARKYLTGVAENIRATCEAALDSKFSKDFFKSQSLIGFDAESPWAVRRLRALLRKQEAEFADTVRDYGHTIQIQDESRVSVEDKVFIPAHKVDFVDSENTGRPIWVSYCEAITWISLIREQHAGRELPGTFNPLIIGELFWFQSRAWEGLAEQYIDKISSICNNFMRQVMDTHCAEDVSSELWSRHVLEALAHREGQAREELNKKMITYRDYPNSEDAAYSAKVEERRLKRANGSVETVKQLLLSDGAYLEAESVKKILKHLNKLSLQSASDPTSALWFSCEQALDSLEAIYELKRQTFIDDIIAQVVDMNMIRGLDQVISPVWVAGLSDAQIQSLAGEPDDVVRVREYHKGRLEKQKLCQQVLKDILGGL